MRLCDVCGNPAALTASVVEEPARRGAAQACRDYDLDLCRSCADLLWSRGWGELGQRAAAAAQRNVEAIFGSAEGD